MKGKLVAEFMGTAFLLLIVVGSGIMGESLSQGNVAIALLANSIATGAGLFVLIQCLGPVSGAHFNPVVSLVEFFAARMDGRALLAFWCAQFSGAVLGVFITHVMFQQAIFQISLKARNSPNLWLSELIASFGLISTIWLAGKKQAAFVPLCVAAYVTGAYWFTSSTSFANPAVTVARMFTNTFCGIAPGGVGPFVLAEVLGASLAFLLLRRI